MTISFDDQQLADEERRTKDEKSAGVTIVAPAGARR